MSSVVEWTGLSEEQTNLNPNPNPNWTGLSEEQKMAILPDQDIPYKERNNAISLLEGMLKKLPGDRLSMQQVVFC